MRHDPSWAIDRWLARLTAHSSLSGADRAALNGLPFRVQMLRARDQVVRPGEYPDEACVVVEGMLARFIQLQDGSRQIVALHIPGDVPDLQSVLLPRAATPIEAITCSRVLRIPHVAVRAIVNASPKVAQAFWRDTLIDAGILSQWVANVGRRDARARMAHLFCELAVRYEQLGFGSRTQFPLLLTQEQLSDALGLTSVHVNRTLKQLRADGIVSQSRGTIEINRWAELVVAADFDPSYLLLGASRSEQDGAAAANDFQPDARPLRSLASTQ